MNRLALLSRLRKQTAAVRALALLVSLGAGARARGVSFAEARAAAIARAPEVQLAKLRTNVSRADVTVAGAFANPTLGVSTATQTARLGATLSVPLRVFGQLGTATRAAQADARTAALDVVVAEHDARWGATLAWVDLWEVERHAALLALGAQDADRLLRIATDKLDAGSGSRLDVVRTNAGRATADAESEAAKRDALAAAARLAPWIGMDPREAVEAVGDPTFPPGTPPLDAMSQWRAIHPLLRRDEAARAAAGAHVEHEERQRWPVIVPQLAVNAFDPTIPATDFIVGVGLDVPILYQRGGEIARARAEEAIARAQSTWDARRLGADVLDAYRRAEGAEAKLSALRERVLPAMHEAASLTEEGYAQGRIDLTRVLEATRALLDARSSEVATVAQRARALADLEHAAGVDLTGSRRAP